MKISCLKVNRMTNPMGYALGQPTFSYVVSHTAAKRQKAARIRIAEDGDMSRVIFDSGMDGAISSIAWQLPQTVTLNDACRYWWDVTVEADNGETAVSEPAWFETPARMSELSGSMIACRDELAVCEFFKTVTLGKAAHARAYVTALGVFELRINGEKVGEEYLTPYSNDYDSWQQVITYDVTGHLRQGENELSVLVAPGWYSGYFGFEGCNQIYGNRLAAFLNLSVTDEHGNVQTVVTDESWSARENAVRSAEIYHGEVYDATWQSHGVCVTEIIPYDKARLEPRRSLPVVVKERIAPKRILHTPKGETVIDMGQNMVGWMTFRCREPKGTKVWLQYGEVLQDGCFFRDNLRSAKAEYTYISDGVERVVRPHMTYFGFRYVKIEGFSADPSLDDIWGEVIYSDMETIGSIETSNPLVNRLFLNSLWGQKGNFVDVPSDCPQRDERMGWTGDAQVFCGTAAFNMDVLPFYSKYGYDMYREQEKYKGCVPMVIPSFHMGPGGSCGWADAATVIPWTTYVHTGNAALLRQQYPSMKLWLEYIRRQDADSGNRGLWQVGFHFGDWLALDGEDPTFPTGATEQFYVASAYYYLSATLTAKAARVLGYEADAETYGKLSEKIKGAIKEEYFTPAGRLAVPTQTGYILALAFDFCPEEYKTRVAADLNARLKKDHGKLRTGFIGTPYLCKVLSQYGYSEMAYQLLLNGDCPGWLYPVRMGATTIWERWDSILPDGHLNPEGMNSLNHYAYGSIVEWMYRYMCGINPVEEAPGFAKIIWSPKPDYRMSHACARCHTPVGTYVSRWHIEGDKLRLRLTVPFGGEAQAELPDAPDTVRVNGVDTRAEGLILDAGDYEIVYVPTKAYSRTYSGEMTVSAIYANEEAKRTVWKALPSLESVPEMMVGSKTLNALAFEGLLHLSVEDIRKADAMLREIPLLPDQIPPMIMDI